MDQAGRIHGNTTTTTTITETHVQTNLRFDPSYVKTLPGALKLAAVVRTSYSLIECLLFILSCRSEKPISRPIGREIDFR